MRSVRSLLAVERGERRERGDIVLGWLTKLAVVLGVAGIVLFDGISVAVTSVNVTDQANSAAIDASDTWVATKDVQKAYLSAVQSAQNADKLNVVDAKTFRIDADGTVHVRLSRTATTLVLYRIGPAKKWADITQDGDGKAVSG
jgi:hypothetical protein